MGISIGLLMRIKLIRELNSWVGEHVSNTMESTRNTRQFPKCFLKSGPMFSDFSAAAVAVTERDTMDHLMLFSRFVSFVLNFFVTVSNISLMKPVIIVPAY